MGDFLMDNLLASIFEAINFLIWLLPALFNLAAFIMSPIIGMCTLGFLAVVRGFGHVSETLTDKWVDRGLQSHWFNYRNLDFVTKIIRVAANFTIGLGIFINTIFIFTMIYVVVWIYQLINNY